MRSYDGVAAVYGASELEAVGLNHERSGDLVVVSDERSWFTYYYWKSDRKAPDYARCVDIHRKPGYDPVELFLNPKIKFPKLKIASKLIRKALGFRILMDLIPLDASLVKGSHGAIPEDEADHALIIGDFDDENCGTSIEATSVYDQLLKVCTRKTP